MSEPYDVIRFKGRDIIKFTLPDGTMQPFYRSSGRNSGMPGTWLPFNGVAPDGWFIKSRFTHPGGKKYGSDKPHLHRFGTELLLTISKTLGAMDIPEGEIVMCPAHVMGWLYPIVAHVAERTAEKAKENTI